MIRKHEYTPTQQRILAVLADGLPHVKADLNECLGDDLASSRTLNVHLCLLRKKLQPKGEDILCVMGMGGKLYYRHVRLLASACDGRK